MKEESPDELVCREGHGLLLVVVAIVSSETSWLIDSGLGWCDPEAELGCLLSEELYLLLAVSLLVVLGAFVDVLLTVLQRAIDQSGEPVGHRRNGFGGAELGAESAVLGSQVAAAAEQRGRCHAQVVKMARCFLLLTRLRN